MDFRDYYNMWDKYGVKLSSPIEITKVLLEKVDLQNEVCDLIWAVSAINQSDKSSASLSQSVMEEIRKLAPSLLNHKCFKKYSTVVEVENRARRHFNGDHLIPQRFIQRQPKIETVLKNNVNNLDKYKIAEKP